MLLTNMPKPRREYWQIMESKVCNINIKRKSLIFFLLANAEMDHAGLMKYKEKAVSGLTSGIELLFKKNKVRVFLFPLFLIWKMAYIMYYR